MAIYTIPADIIRENNCISKDCSVKLLKFADDTAVYITSLIW